MSDVAKKIQAARKNNRKVTFYNWFFFRSRGDSPFGKMLIHLTLLLACSISLFPVLRVVSVSLRSGNRVVSTNLDIIPTERVIIPENMSNEEFNMLRYRSPEQIRTRLRSSTSGRAGTNTRTVTYPNGEKFEFDVPGDMHETSFERLVMLTPDELNRSINQILLEGTELVDAAIQYENPVTEEVVRESFRLPAGASDEMLIGYLTDRIDNNVFLKQDLRNVSGQLIYDGKVIETTIVSNMDSNGFQRAVLNQIKPTREVSYNTATLGNYASVLLDYENPDDGFLTWVWNSIIITLSTAFMGLALASTSAYAFSRFSFPGKKTGLIFLLATQMIPGVMMIVPIYLMAQNLGLVGQLNGLVFAYSVGSIPFSIWILKGFYDTIPIDLEEAARIDGATQMQTFFRIILPLATPAMSIVFLFNFMQAWNDYMLARVLLGDSLRTWVLGLVRLQGTFATDWGRFSAAALMVSVPVVMLFMASSKYLVSGLTLGSVKG